MNSVNLTGRLGRDPELKYSQSGTAICSFSLALDEGKDKKPSWVDVTCFKETAEACAQYLRKGDEAGITGRLQEDTWEKDGQTRSKLRVVAMRVDFLRRKGGDSADSDTVSDAGGGPADLGLDDPFGDE